MIGLVGTKSDLSDWEVTREEAEDFANENGFYFEIVSAKTGDKVKDFFNSILNIFFMSDDTSIIRQFIKDLEDEKRLSYLFSENDKKKKVYCERCKSIPLITISKERYLNIDIKCNCGERKNVSIEEYIRSLPSIDDLLEINTSCYYHPDKKGMIFCFDCYQFLCDECSQQHNKNHELIEENKKIDNLKKCDYHKYKKGKNYSQINQQYRCSICIILFDNNIIYIKKLSKEKQASQNNDETFLNDVHRQNLDKAIRVIEDCQEKYKEQYKTDKKKKNLIKIFRIKDIFEEYRIKYPYFRKLYQIIFYMKNNYQIKNYNFKANLDYYRTFHIQSFEEKMTIIINSLI